MLRIPAPLLAVVGYGFAVAVATAIALFLFHVIEFLSGGSGAPMIHFLRHMPTMYSISLVVTVTFALPGFLVVLMLAWRLCWRNWLIFAVTGAANAILALLLFDILNGGGNEMLNPIMVSSCVPAGFAGGLCYWISAGRFLHSPRDAAAT